jgi:Activator of Hsp90 ATPase homolog 1-like protein
MPHTVRLHRVLTTKPEKVFRAFFEADALAKWLPPNGFACIVHQLDAKVGGILPRATATRSAASMSRSYPMSTKPLPAHAGALCRQTSARPRWAAANSGINRYSLAGPQGRG